MADDPENKIELKASHNEIINEHKELKKEIVGYQEIPLVRIVIQEMANRN